MWITFKAIRSAMAFECQSLTWGYLTVVGVPDKWFLKVWLSPRTLANLMSDSDSLFYTARRPEGDCLSNEIKCQRHVSAFFTGMLICWRQKMFRGWALIQSNNSFSNQLNMFSQCVEFSIESKRYIDFFDWSFDVVKFCIVIRNTVRLWVFRYFYLEIFQFAIPTVELRPISPWVKPGHDPHQRQ